jgi:hypothetical protein
MAKAPCAGRVKTRLEPAVPPDALVTLYRCLIEDTVALARAAGVPRTAVVCPRGDGGDVARWLDIEVLEQEGDGLAAGLDSVFRLFIGDGCRRVIAFNGDTPHLPPETLAGAFALLACHDLVVGPTEDGGYYLVGAKGAHPGLFDAHGVGTGAALRALLARAAERGLGVALTEAWYDVDEGSDLARLGAELRRTPARAPRTAAWLAAWNGRAP